MGKKKGMFTPEGHRIEVYHKGKGHRLLVDTATGRVVATNPLPLALLAPLAAKALPLAIEAGTQFLASEAERESVPREAPLKERGVGIRGALTSFEKALMLEALERRH